MVEIVGKDPSRAKECVCNKCASILKYYPLDVHSYNFRDYTGNDFGKAITCPGCQNKIRVG